MKAIFLPKDYRVQLYKKMRDFRQKEMDVQKYTEEFHKLDIRVDHDEEMEEKIARYMGGLRFNIQDELSLATPRSVDECYQLALKAQEKIRRRQEKQSNNRG